MREKTTLTRTIVLGSRVRAKVLVKGEVGELGDSRGLP